MARSFDGVDDDINFGSDAGIDNLIAAGTTKLMSAAFYLKRGATGFVTLFNKFNGTAEDGWQICIRGAGGNHELRLQVSMNVTDGLFDSPASLSSTTTPYHIVVTWDANLMTNVPTMYIDGAAQAVDVQQAPVGIVDADASYSLKLAEADDNTLNCNGVFGWLCFDATIFSAAEANRARWWGRPKGGLLVYHPLMTDKLTNEGSATANGTATGATVVPLIVPVVRPGAAMMGLGVGW